MASPLLRRILAATLMLAAVAALWWLLAPTQLGGWTSYAVVRGPSMEPTLQSGDFVIARARGEYGVGDVVLFDSETLGAHVLHRIVDVEGDRFVTRGDNKDEVDPERPLAADVVGEQWVRLPGLGSVVDWVREPLHLLIVMVILAFLMLGGGREVSRRRGRGHEPLPPADAGPAPAGSTAGSVARTLLTAGLIGALLFAGVVLVSWSRSPSARQTVDGAYTHTGTFSYSASPRRSVVYPTGEIETGQAVFTNLERDLQIGFAYRFLSGEPHDVRGSAALEARISDGEGWARTLEVEPPMPFTGSEAAVRGVLDLGRVKAITERMKSLTGSTTTVFAVDVVPRVEVLGYAGESVLRDEFAPALPFRLDPVALRLAVDAETEAPLEPSQEGSAIRAVDASFQAGPLVLPVADARTIGVTGLVVCLVLAGVSALFLAARHGTPGRKREPERIAGRYGGRIVDTGAPVPAGRWVTELDDIESLVRVAELYERMILHTEDNGRHQYVVDDGVAVYRFTLDDAATGELLAPAAGR